MEDNKNQEVQTKETVTETVEQNTQEKQPSRNEIMRELSKEYGMNLFDAEGLKEFKAYQDNKKTEAQKLQEKLAEYESKENTWEQEKNDIVFNYESKLAAMKLNIKEESLDDVLMLAKSKVSDEVSISDAMSQIIEKYPQFSNAQTSTTEEPKKAGLSFKEKTDDKQIKEENPFLKFFK